MPYKFNPLSGGLDFYEAATAAGANTELSNLGTVALNADLDPAAPNVRDLGNATNYYKAGYMANTYTNSAGIYNSTLSTITGSLEGTAGALPSGVSPAMRVRAVSSNALGVYTSNNATANSTATPSLYIETGNKTAGTGDSGNINVQPGTSLGGNPGTINLSGGIKHAYVSLNTTQSLTLAQTLINTVGTITLTLPPVSGLEGKYYTFTHTGTSLTDVVTIDGNGGETINGVSDFQLHLFGESVTLYCDGAIWRVSNRYIPSVWTSFTPTGSFTNTTYTGLWRRSGDSAEVQIKGTLTGTPGAATLSVDLPTNMTIDTAKLSATANSANIIPAGIIVGVDVGTSYYTGIARYSTTSAVVFSNDGALASWSQAAPFTWVSGDIFSTSFTVPIVDWEG